MKEAYNVTRGRPDPRDTEIRRLTAVLGKCHTALESFNEPHMDYMPRLDMTVPELLDEIKCTIGGYACEEEFKR